jgi:hypothetical protein
VGLEKLQPREGPKEILGIILMRAEWDGVVVMDRVQAVCQGYGVV